MRKGSIVWRSTRETFAPLLLSGYRSYHLAKGPRHVNRFLTGGFDTGIDQIVAS